GGRRGGRLRRARGAPGQPGPALGGALALDQPRERRRRQGPRRDGDRGHRRRSRPRARPGLEGLAEHRRARRLDRHPRRDRRPRRDPAHLADRRPRRLAAAHPALLLGRGADAVGRDPTRRLLLLRLGGALQHRLLADRGQPGRRLQQLLGDALPGPRPDHPREPRPRPDPRLLLPDRLRADRGPGRPRLPPRPVPAQQPAPLQRGPHPARRRPRPGPLRRDLPRLGRQQHRLVGRGRDQVLPRRRRRLSYDLRHRHRGLLRRRLELRAPPGPVRGLLDPVPGAAPGDPTRRPLPQPAALRDVPLARPGPDPLRRGPAGDDPGARLARGPRRQVALPAAPGRHRLDRPLVPGGAPRPLPNPARPQRSRGDL
ncbi:MAG: FIG01197961: hypothetical protein, partial [uncultured Thermomicrobiales bacterium]